MNYTLRSPPHNATRQLTELGLTGLEAEVYCSLVPLGTATAYEVAQKIGKPTANVYKASRSLADKGAVAVQEGSKRLLKAIPPAEFLGTLARRQLELADSATKQLEALRPAQDVDQLYAIENVDVAFERAGTMLAATRQVAVVDTFPQTLARLEPALRKTARRRSVSLYLQAYEPTDIPADSMVISSHAEQILAQWNCEFLIVVIDGKQTLFALFDHTLTSVHQAYWSNSMFLSCVQHAGMMREHLYHQLQNELATRKPSVARIREMLAGHPTFYSAPVPGQLELHQMVAPPDAHEPASTQNVELKSSTRKRSSRKKSSAST